MENQTPVQYEELVHKLFSKELEKHVDLANFRIFHNKRYSGKSGHRHQIDVSAEFKIAGVKILIVIECKLYKRNVGIDDIMELTTRLDDIGAHKGVLVTTIGFQAGAAKMARSRGIALVRACDLGWYPHLESPVLERRRHEEFCINMELFLTGYLRISSNQEIDRAVKRIATFDVVSPLGVTPYPLGSLRKERGRVQPACMFAPPHAFVVEGECSQIILDTRGLFALLALDEVGQ